MHNIMLDLEALDSKPTGVLVSIGAVYFDPNSCELGDTFYREVDITTMDYQIHEGRTISASTLSWWMQQSEKARGCFAATPGKSGITGILYEFADCFIKDKVHVNIWGNGSDFDNALLSSVYNTFKIPTPWMFWNNRCFRTLKNLCHVAPDTFEGERHNALDDAINQAKWAQKIFKELNNG